MFKRVVAYPVSHRTIGLVDTRRQTGSRVDTNLQMQPPIPSEHKRCEHWSGRSVNVRAGAP